MPRDLATPTPAVSVLTPAHDAARVVGATVDSMLAQDFRDWEMIVVDDGSRDGTAEVVTARRDPRIRLLRQAHAGLAAARSRAMAEARGEAILLLDADGWLAPDALSRLVAALATAPEAVGAHGAFALVAEEARPGDAPPRRRAGPFPAGDLLEALLVGNLLAHGGHLLLRREAVRQAGPVLPHLRHGAEWEYWIRLSLLGPWVAAEGRAPLLCVRQRPGRAPQDLAPAMRAIWGNPALAERLGPARFAAIRRRAEAEQAWIVGRELIRHGQRAAGLERLRAAVAQAPTPRRALLLAAAHALPVLPRRLHGPFLAYPG
ncbi:glycosyltransferase family A protein [Roseicella aquatilis]|uniref:Glycosyltransferase family 2 protein n=1 Tax=Roseicella aquatilis TaxID=2527868 RepID=A0A4R4D5Z1_9PROT|nr:glycosyltransferase family A protein [Roseicella aquatilis]TCZ53924.1 glycosyltransferase family 2 protein [Roseicella aquatilis]